MKYPFSFEVICYCREYGDNNYYKQYGMGICESYGDAAAQIEDYFGNDIVKINLIKLYEESKLIFLSKEMIQKYDRQDCPAVNFEIPANESDERI